MNFSDYKYQHVERLGSEEVNGILDNYCFVMPKLDGTNTLVFYQDGNIIVGSRNRFITPENDNQGAARYIKDNEEKFIAFFKEYPDIVLYGEFLVKVHIKTYNQDAWGKFYVFDMFDTTVNRYLRPSLFPDMLEKFGIYYIPVVAEGRFKEEDIVKLAKESSDFLLPEGTVGEGVVVHAPEFINKYGRTTWAKVVTDEYKVVKYVGKSFDDSTIEARIVEMFCTDAFIHKEFEKVRLDVGTFESKHIGRLLGTIWHEFVIESTFDALNAFKNPTINFKLLQSIMIEKVKKTLKEVF